MDETNMTDGQCTALSLLRMSGVGGEEFTGKSLEVRIAELEASANAITAESFRFWRQNEDLQVNLVGASRTVNTGNGQTAVHDQRGALRPAQHEGVAGLRVGEHHPPHDGQRDLDLEEVLTAALRVSA